MEHKVQLVYCVDHRGVNKVKEFLLEQNPKIQAKMILTIDLLGSLGLDLVEPYSKYLGNGLRELRVQSSTHFIRIFYFHLQESTFLLTHAYTKKSNQTSRNEIERAFRLKEQYEKS